MLKSRIGYEKASSFDYTDQKHEKSSDKVIISNVFLRNTDNKTISTFLIKPNKQGSFPGIIFLHWLEPHAENSNKDEFLPIAIELAKNHDIASILPDAFWSTTPEKYKQNPKIGWETTFENDSKLNETQIKNLLITVDFFESLDFVNNNKIAFCGHDFGAMFGCLLGSFKPNIKAYVFMTPTGKFADWYRFGNSLNTLDEFLNYSKAMSIYDPVTNIKDIKGNILFQYALNDFYVPVEKGLELAEKTSLKPLVKWYKTNHGMNEKVFEEAKNWLINELSD